MLSVGVPVGLGIFLAWVDRSRSGASTAAGLLAAVAGALAGAWLGFHAATDLLALVTAIVGATAGANLMLVALDIDRRSPRPRACGGAGCTDRRLVSIAVPGAGLTCAPRFR